MVSENGKPDSLIKMLAVHANPNNGNPLVWAAQHHSEETVQILLNAKADPFAAAHSAWPSRMEDQ